MNEIEQIAVRRATIEDAETLAELGAKTFLDTFAAHPLNDPADTKIYVAETYNARRQTDELLNPNTIYYVAEIRGNAIGYAKLRRNSTEPCVTGTNPIELHRIYVEHEYLGKGVGEILLTQCFEIAKQLNCDSIWLGVWEHNPRARRFYEKKGFRLVGEHHFQFGNDPQSDLVMEKTL